MTAADVDPTTAMVMRGDWGDRRVFLRFAVDYARSFPLVAEADGEIVATGTGTANGPVGWIGGIFVDAVRRKSGLGTAITLAVMDALRDAGCRSFLLVASQDGRRIYERLGFEVQTFYEVLASEGRANRHDPTTDVLTEGTLADETLVQMIEIDRAATGEDRAGLLTTFASPSTTRLASGVGGLDGFAVRAPWGGWATIAAEPSVGVAMLESRRRTAAADHRVSSGLPLENREGRERLLAAGWTARYRAPRMLLGEPPPWRPESLWGQFGMAIG
jgi:GNAT superfamily N-acetyltransferase